MDDLFDRMKDSDVWVFGTPVYWWGATAQFKLFLDRWYAPWYNAATKELFKHRRVILVVTLGDGNSATANPTLDMFERAFAYVGLELAATVLAPGVHTLGEASEHSELMQKAREAGRTAMNG